MASEQVQRIEHYYKAKIRLLNLQKSYVNAKKSLAIRQVQIQEMPYRHLAERKYHGRIAYLEYAEGKNANHARKKRE